MDYTIPSIGNMKLSKYVDFSMQEGLFSLSDKFFIRQIKSDDKVFISG